jgi:hypothetical protein
VQRRGRLSHARCDRDLRARELQRRYPDQRENVRWRGHLRVEWHDELHALRLRRQHLPDELLDHLAVRERQHLQRERV